MTRKQDNEHIESLRRTAEKLVREKSDGDPPPGADDLSRAVNELQVYQAELEIQNEELRETQNELENSRNKYHELFNIAPVGYLLLAPDLLIREANLAFLDLLQISREEMKNRPLLGFVSSKDHERLLSYLNRLDTRQPIPDLMIDIKRSDNTYRNTKISGVLTESADDSSPFTLLTVTDITELKKTRTALEETRALHAYLVESSCDHIFMLSTDGHYMASNNRVGQLNLETEEELIGKSIYDVYEKDDADTYIQYLQQVIATKEPVGFEHRITVDNTTRHHIDRLYPIMKNDRIWAVGGICHDITELKAAEAKKKELEKQLFHARKLESLGNLAGGIAHDFNNILASIIGFAEIAMEDAEQGITNTENLSEILTAGHRAKSLVKQILAFARQSDEKVKPIRADLIVKEVIKLLRSTTPSNIEIKERVESKASVLGNPTQLHQVMMNLCTNAVHAMEDTGGTMEIRLKETAVETSDGKRTAGLIGGNYLKIEVSDTGSGIAPEILDSIFEPYYTTKPAGEGTGMGLSVVQGIAESYGGAVSVESELDRGSRFVLHFPVTEEETESRDREKQTVPKGSERILFVDDETAIVKVASQVLEKFGYRVTTRKDGQKALETFLAAPDEFDLVITDMTMPAMTGDELARQVLAIRPDVPVILCTGFSNKISEESAHRIGIKTVLSKPIDMADLGKIIREVLDEAKTGI